MAALGQLTLRLAAETSEFQGDLGRAAFMADRAAARMINSFAKVGSGIVAGLGAGVVTAAVYQMTKSVIDGADQLQDMSDRTGIAVDELSALAYAAKVSGSDIESLETSLGLLSKKAVDAATGNKALEVLFKSLGVEVKDANGKMIESKDIFAQLGRAFNELQDPATRTAVALELMGRGGAKLIPAAMNLAALKKEAVDTGAIMSGQFAADANKFNDNLDKMGMLSKRAAGAMLEDVVPALNKFLERIVEAKKGTDSFLTALSDAASLTALGWFEKPNETAARLGKQVVELGKNLEDLKKQGLKPGDFRFDMVADQLEIITRRLKLLKQEGEASGRPRDNAAQNGAGAAAQAAAQAARTRDAAVQEAMAYEAKQKAAKAAAEAAKKAADARQKEIDAVVQLEARLGALKDESVLATVTREMDKGRYKDFSAKGKEEVLAAARALDEYTAAVYRQEEAQKAAEARNADMTRGQQVLSDFEERNRQMILGIDLQAEMSMLGANERQVRAALYELDQQRLAALKEIYKVENPDDRVALIAEVNRAYEQQAAAIRQTLEAAQAMENNWKVGAERGLQQYLDTFKNNAYKAQDAVVRTFGAMEDALTDFVMGGKAKFSDFARSVIADLIRIQIRAAITGPLAGIFQNILGSFSPSGSVSVGSTVTNTVGGTTTTFSAGGNVMTGRGPMALRRYASGGVATSPQLAVFGEGSRPEAYVPLPDGRTIPVTLSGGRQDGGTNVIVNVNVESGKQDVMGNGQGEALGRAVSLAVQAELIKQKRNGGLLATA